VLFPLSQPCVLTAAGGGGRRRQPNKEEHKTFPLVAAGYIAHWGFLAAFVTLCMHVQVATRLLSTCPPLYWFAAHLCTGKHARLVWTYFLVYGSLGFVLFPRFYPWT